MRITLLVCAIALVGCSKKKQDDPAVAPKQPTSTKQQDALWALAPENAIAGMVVTPTALARIEAGAIELNKFFASAPELAFVKMKLDEGFQELLGTTNPSLAAAGLTSQKGLAVFLVKDSKAPMVIMPVGDRDVFLKIAKGEKGADGIDTIKRDKCKTVKDVYACSRDIAVLDTLGKGDLSEPLKLAGARGDIEYAGAIPDPKIVIGGVVQLARGGAVMRAGVKGLPPEVATFMVNAKPRHEGDKTAGFALMNLGPLMKLAGAEAPDDAIIPGVTFADLVKTVVGPFTMTVENGAPIFDIRLPLSDGGPAKKILEQCDKLMPMPDLQVSVKDGACHFTLPQMSMTLDAWVENNVLRISQKDSKHVAKAAPLSPVASEIANGEWAFAVFGRGTMLAPIPVEIPLDNEAVPQEVTLLLRAMTMVNELAVAAKIDGDVVRGIVSVRTAFANPEDVVAKIVAIDPAKVLKNKAGAGKAIADAHPKSPFASDFASGYGGMMAPASVIGILAAVAIPAFMDYMKKSKVSEAELQLNKLRKNLQVSYITNAEFPKGTVGPSPGKTCCGSDRNLCFDPKAWEEPLWQELDFMITEPHMFRYSYESKDGKSFTAKAIGDLDCDGTDAAWVMSGTIDGNGTPAVNIAPPPKGEY